MSAVSKNQQRAAGIALKAKEEGKVDSLPKGAAKEMAKSMSKKELTKFAKTKHDNLPVKKETASVEEVVSEEMLGVEPGEIATNKSKKERVEDRKDPDKSYKDTWISRVNTVAASGRHPMIGNTKGTRVAEHYLDTLNNLNLIFETDREFEKTVKEKSTDELQKMLSDYEYHAKFAQSSGDYYNADAMYDMIRVVKSELHRRNEDTSAPKKGAHLGVVPGSFGAPGMAENKIKMHSKALNESYSEEQQKIIEKLVEEIALKIGDLEESRGAVGLGDAKSITESFIEIMIEGSSESKKMIDYLIDHFDSADSYETWSTNPQKAVDESLKKAINVLSAKAWEKYSSTMQMETIKPERWRQLAGINEGLFGNWKTSMEEFNKTLGQAAVEIGDKNLLQVADKMVGYTSFMKKPDPAEFANHLKRNLTKQQGSPAYRDTENPVLLMQGRLENAAKAIKNYKDAKFANFASEFFTVAAQALSANV